MPALQNTRHERFCLALFGECASATQAYKRAGYVASGHAAEVNASRLLRNAEVKARMDELKEEQAKAATLTREEILQRVLDAHDKAHARGQSAAALRALEMLGGELHGMFKGQSVVDVNARMRDLSDAELLALVDRNLAALGLRAPIADQAESTEGERPHDE